MNSKLFLLYNMISLCIANQYNVFIPNYFLYKRTPYVVGFSCNNGEGDYELMKTFSKVGIFSTLHKLNKKFIIQPLLHTLYRKLGIFVDLTCYNVVENKYILSKASSSRLYGELHYWLILGRDLNESIKMLNDTEYSISTDLVITVMEGEDIIMYDIFNHCKYRGGLMNITKLGSWNNLNGFNITFTHNKFSRRANFHGMNLRMAGLVLKRPKHMPLEMYLQDYASKQDDSMSKFTYSVWLHLSDLYNFTIEPKELTVWKATNRNGPMIKMLLERSAELGGSTGILTQERSSIITSIPAWPLRTCFMFRTTQSKNIKINNLLRPLPCRIWYLIIIFIVVAIFVFAWILIMEHFNDKFERNSSAFLIIIGSMCQQGSDIQITHTSSRIAFLQMMLFSLLIYNYYSASIVSARLSEPLEKINDSLNELSKTSLNFGAEPSLYFNIFIQRSDWEAQQFYYKRWTKVPEKEKFMSAAIGIKRILHEDFAYHIDVNVAFPVIEKLFNNEQICQLTMVYLVRPTDSSIFIASNSSFVEITKVGVAKIREMGLRTRLVKRWAARTPECRTDLFVIEPVSIYEVAPAFLLLLFGGSLGIFICIIERKIYCKRYYHYRFKRKLRNTLFKTFTHRKKK